MDGVPIGDVFGRDKECLVVEKHGPEEYRDEELNGECNS